MFNKQQIILLVLHKELTLSTPIITGQNSQITSTSQAEGLLEGEIPVFFYSTTSTVNENSQQMPVATNPSSTTWQSTNDFIGMYGNYYFRSGVLREGIWYWSNIVLVGIGRARMKVYFTEATVEFNSSDNGAFKVSSADDISFAIVPTYSPYASAIRVTTSEGVKALKR